MKSVQVFTLVVVVSLAGVLRAEEDKWVSQDKFVHFGVSFGLAGGIYGLGVGSSGRRDISLIAGAAIGIGFGSIKELLDLTGSGQPSIKDFVWDITGVAAGLILGLCIDLAVRGPEAGWGDQGPALTVPSRVK